MWEDTFEHHKAFGIGCTPRVPGSRYVGNNASKASKRISGMLCMLLLGYLLKRKKKKGELSAPRFATLLPWRRS